MLDAVLVQHSVHIDRPIQAVNAALAAAPSGWLPNLDGPAPRVASQALAGVGVREKVTVKLGQPVTSGWWTEVPITWQASYIERLFPLMTGKIGITPVAGGATTLTVCGSYEPPLRRLAGHLDEVLIYNVAAEIVIELAESVANRLDAAAATY